MVSDSFPIGFDNNPSTSMTENFNDFICPLIPIMNRVVKGYGGTIKVRREGKVIWKIIDDDIKLHSIIIHNVNYITYSPIYLLPPQKWAQKIDSNHMIPDGTWCTRKSEY